MSFKQMIKWHVQKQIINMYKVAQYKKDEYTTLRQGAHKSESNCNTDNAQFILFI